MDVEKGSIQDFAIRFEELCKEARAFGCSSTFTVVSRDALGLVDVMECGQYGGRYQNLGAIESLKKLMMEESPAHP